jgi:alpha-tubulin suppressor-like RCC1 family protein
VWLGCALGVDGASSDPSALVIEPPPTRVPYTNVRDVSAGDWHTCFITECEEVKCWGRNVEGQSTVPATPGRSFMSVSAGRAHTCARGGDGSILCWGDDTYGQVSGAPPGMDFIYLDVGGDHSCAVRTSGRAVCWGDNRRGQATVPLSRPVDRVEAGRAFTAVAVGGDDVVAAWGDNARGQTNLPTGFGTSFGRFKLMSLGGAHGCAVTHDDGRLICWGDDSYGQVAPDPSSVLAELVPDPIAEGPGFIFPPLPDAEALDWWTVAAGERHTCAVSDELQVFSGSDGNTFCFGESRAGKTVPPRGHRFVSLTAGHEHTCGLADGDRRVVCWGENLQGQSTVPTHAGRPLGCGVGPIRPRLEPSGS